KRLRFLLGFRDVRLVEWIDAEDGARDRRGEFPPEEFRAETIEARREPKHRMTGCFERVQLCRVGFVDLRRDRDERAIVAVSSGTSERFVDDGQRASAVLSGALGDQLLDPQTERRQAR